jgi:hypothetical protein
MAHLVGGPVHLKATIRGIVEGFCGNKAEPSEKRLVYRLMTRVVGASQEAATFDPPLRHQFPRTLFHWLASVKANPTRQQEYAFYVEQIQAGKGRTRGQLQKAWRKNHPEAVSPEELTRKLKAAEEALRTNHSQAKLWVEIDGEKKPWEEAMEGLGWKPRRGTARKAASRREKGPPSKDSSVAESASMGENPAESSSEIVDTFADNARESVNHVIPRVGGSLRGVVWKAAPPRERWKIWMGPRVMPVKAGPLPEGVDLPTENEPVTLIPVNPSIFGSKPCARTEENLLAHPPHYQPPARAGPEEKHP